MKRKRPLTVNPYGISVSKQENQIFLSIRAVREQLKQAQQRFDFVTDDMLIDSYIHELISLNKKYDYLIKVAKEMGILAESAHKTG